MVFESMVGSDHQAPPVMCEVSVEVLESFSLAAAIASFNGNSRLATPERHGQSTWTSLLAGVVARSRRHAPLVRLPRRALVLSRPSLASHRKMCVLPRRPRQIAQRTRTKGAKPPATDNDDFEWGCPGSSSVALGITSAAVVKNGRKDGRCLHGRGPYDDLRVHTD